MSLKQIGSLVAYQLLCARPSADMHMYYTCCAHVTQLMGGNMITILQCFDYGRILFVPLVPLCQKENKRCFKCIKGVSLIFETK